MSVTSALRAEARSAFRLLFRASTYTFQGDPTVRDAFRSRMRTRAREMESLSDLKTYQESVTLAKDIAVFLRQNIVQGTRVDNVAGKDGTYKLRINEHTELGDNDSIKNPQSMTLSSRRARKRGESSEAGSLDPSLAVPPRAPLYYSVLKKAHRDRTVPVLLEKDLEESFVRGSGPGGQSINKTQNNVQLLHKPSGLRVSCQETRSLETNRKLARRLLLDKLDKELNPGLSKAEMQKSKTRERARRRRKKAKKKERLKESTETGGMCE